MAGREAYARLWKENRERLYALTSKFKIPLIELTTESDIQSRPHSGIEDMSRKGKAMNTLLEQLHDIDGLDAISWWPLAIGWWVLIGLGAHSAQLRIGLCYVAWRVAFKRSWKSDTFKKLAALERKIFPMTTARKTAITLSEYLRRIALRRFSRKECAGLTGEAWLKWLAGHDPKKFDWEKKGDSFDRYSLRSPEVSRFSPPDERVNPSCQKLGALDVSLLLAMVCAAVSLCRCLSDG